MTKYLKAAIVDLMRYCDHTRTTTSGYCEIPEQLLDEVRYWFNKEVRRHGQVHYIVEAPPIEHIPHTGRKD
jgi:hypothetical protein